MYRPYHEKKTMLANLADVKQELSSIYKYCGSVPTVNDLPDTENYPGDVYNVEDTDMNYAYVKYDEVQQKHIWDPLGPSLQGYLTKTEAEETYSTIETVNDHIEDTSNPHGVTKEQVGLGSVDNTADLDKPISTATQTALDDKVNVDHTGNVTIKGVFLNGLPDQSLNSYGNYSHAEGYSSKTYGQYSHAEGHTTRTASQASYAHAEGRETRAGGEYSHVDGYKAVSAEGASGTSQVVNPHNYAWVWNGDNSIADFYFSHGTGTFNINPKPEQGSTDPTTGLWIGGKKLSEILAGLTVEIADPATALMSDMGKAADAYKTKLFVEGQKARYIYNVSGTDALDDKGGLHTGTAVPSFYMLGNVKFNFSSKGWNAALAKDGIFNYQKANSLEFIAYDPAGKLYHTWSSSGGWQYELIGDAPAGLDPRNGAVLPDFSAVTLTGYSESDLTFTPLGSELGAAPYANFALEDVPTRTIEGSTKYRVGDLIGYNGKAYRCKTEYTSASTPVTPDADTLDWVEIPTLGAETDPVFTEWKTANPVLLGNVSPATSKPSGAVIIGNGAFTSSVNYNNPIAIGNAATANNSSAIAIGSNITVSGLGSAQLGHSDTTLSAEKTFRFRDTVIVNQDGEIPSANLDKAFVDKTGDEMTGSLIVPDLTIGDRETGSIVGPGSLAIGHAVKATSSASIAEGGYTTASNTAAHAEGNNTTASGGASHAEGEFTTASGYGSHAEGIGTVARNRYEHSEGTYSVTNRAVTFVAGMTYSVGDIVTYDNYQYQCKTEHIAYSWFANNWKRVNYGVPTNTLKSIGVGTADNARLNAVEVMGDGKVFIKGVGGYDGTNPTGKQNAGLDLATVLDGKPGAIINITWTELKSMRDEGTLVPGQQYRITDYKATTTQNDTQSANHQFDIIVTADANNKLNEVARAALHEGDTYFANCKLEAWKVWYCLDNDYNRFAWVESCIVCNGTKFLRYAEGDSPGSTYPYCWKWETFKRYTSTETPTAGSYAYTQPTGASMVDIDSVNVLVNGKGVIYRLIDEFDNDCGYDFKGVQFSRTVDNNTTWYYTFTNNSQDATVPTSSTRVYGFHYGNKIEPYPYFGLLTLNNIVFNGAGCCCNKFGQCCFSNTVGATCSRNTFEAGCHDISLASNSTDNTFRSGCSGPVSVSGNNTVYQPANSNMVSL